VLPLLLLLLLLLLRILCFPILQSCANRHMYCTIIRVYSACPFQVPVPFRPPSIVEELYREERMVKRHSRLTTAPLCAAAAAAGTIVAQCRDTWSFENTFVLNEGCRARGSMLLDGPALLGSRALLSEACHHFGQCTMQDAMPCHAMLLRCCC